MKKAVFTGLFFAVVVFIAAAALPLSKIAAHGKLDIERKNAIGIIVKLRDVVDGILNAENAWDNYTLKHTIQRSIIYSG